MSRTGPKPVRRIRGDGLYNEQSLQKLINLIMQDGKKSLAEKIVYTALTNIAKKISITEVELLNKVIQHASPIRAPVKRIVKGRSMSVPRDTDASQKIMHALRIVTAASRSLVSSEGIGMITALEKVLEQAYNETGKAIELKKSMESAAEANKAHKI